MSNLDSLIERWRNSDERAAEAIYNLHRQRTFQLAYALLGNLEDAEEAAQDALTYALLNIGRFDEKRSKFTTWLHMITVNRSRDLLRKRHAPTLSLSDWLFHRQPSIQPTSKPEQRAETSEMRSVVWESVQQLNPILREALVLRHWGDYTYQEIAAIVGCPMKTAQSRVRLAHQKLAQTLVNADIRQIVEEAL